MVPLAPPSASQAPAVLPPAPLASAALPALQLGLHRLHGRRVAADCVRLPETGCVLGADSQSLTCPGLGAAGLHLAVRHAVVRVEDGRYFLEPGTKDMVVALNGEKIPWGTRRALQVDDRIDIGFATLLVGAEPPDAWAGQDRAEATASKRDEPERDNLVSELAVSSDAWAGQDRVEAAVPEKAGAEKPAPEAKAEPERADSVPDVAAAPGERPLDRFPFLVLDAATAPAAAPTTTPMTATPPAFTEPAAGVDIADEPDTDVEPDLLLPSDRTPSAEAGADSAAAQLLALLAHDAGMSAGNSAMRYAASTTLDELVRGAVDNAHSGDIGDVADVSDVADGPDVGGAANTVEPGNAVRHAPRHGAEGTYKKAAMGPEDDILSALAAESARVLAGGAARPTWQGDGERRSPVPNSLESYSPAWRGSGQTAFGRASHRDAATHSPQSGLASFFAAEFAGDPFSDLSAPTLLAGPAGAMPPTGLTGADPSGQVLSAISPVPASASFAGDPFAADAGAAAPFAAPAARTLEDILEGPLGIDDVLERLQRGCAAGKASASQTRSPADQAPIWAGVASGGSSTQTFVPSADSASMSEPPAPAQTGFADGDPLAALDSLHRVPDPLCLLAGLERLPTPETGLAAVLHREHRSTGIDTPYQTADSTPVR